MEPEEFNRRCAEVVHPEGSYERNSGNDYWVIRDENGAQGYPMPDFYHDANQRNKVIEKMRITTAWNDTNNHWMVKLAGRDCLDETSSFGMEMEAAQIACITKVLEAL